MFPILVSSNINIFYLTGRVFTGYVYLPVDSDPICFVQRPTPIQTERVIQIRKPEEIPALLQKKGLSVPERIGLELDFLNYNETQRLVKAFNIKELENASTVMRHSRMIKTEHEIALMRHSAQIHTEVYQAIPSLYQEGMRDIDLQIEIEHLMRQKGSIGLFRTFGSNMEVFMGTVLVGENAATPSPFDFSLGGAGWESSMPLGANGTLIKPGNTISVDMAGNFTPYISDMTRTFSLGKLPKQAYDAHQVSADIHQMVQETVRPGIACADIYNKAIKIVEQAEMSPYFMGMHQQAKFIGHGVGLEVNELPVIMPRSKDMFQAGMIIAIEPKLIVPEIGAVGFENTYLIKEDEVEKLTVFEEGIIPIG